PMKDRAGKPQAWVTQMYARDVLRAFVAACDEARIDVVPVKGIVTGGLLYESVEERPISDIDVRVRRRDFGRLVALGRARGWPSPWRSRAYLSAAFAFEGIEVDARAFVAPPGMCAIT